MNPLDLAKSLTPPLLWEVLKRFKRSRYGFEGHYPSYEAALKACGTAGYHDEVIVAKTLERLLALKDELQRHPDRIDVRTQQVLSALLLPIEQRHDPQILRVLDFGGALGNLYFQLKRFLPPGLTVRWVVVDTPVTVAAGRQHLEDEHLTFQSDLSEVTGPFDVIVVSSSLQYMERPTETLRDLVALEGRYLLINRTPFLAGPDDRLTVQRVPPEIYTGSYPAWFLSESRWLGLFEQQGLALRMRWTTPDLKQLDGQWHPDQGMLLERVGQPAR